MHDPIHSLAQIFKKLPGIGERQAHRIVYDILLIFKTPGVMLSGKGAMWFC